MTSEIVVIGARRSNAPEYWEDSRIAFLEGDDVVRRGLPKNAKVVIFTKFMGHSQYDKAMNEAKKRDLRIIPGLTGSGQLKATLSQLLMTFQTHDGKKEEVVPTLQEALKNPKPIVVEEAKPERPPHRAVPGQVIGWVREYLKTRPEATRLEVIAAGREAGFKGAALQSAFYSATGREFPSNKPKTERRAKASINDSEPESRVVALLDEAIAALQLIREEAKKLDKKMDKFKKLMEAMKGFGE